MNLTKLKTVKAVTPVFTGLLFLSLTACTSSRYDAYGAPDEEVFGLSNFDEVGFDEIDSDGDGRVSWSDITSNYKEELESIDWTDPEALSVFDNDMSGFLDRKEYSGFTSILEQQLGSAEGDASEGYFTFDDADANSDGVLNEQELGDGTLAEGLQYRLFDDNEDGVLDQEEFKEYVSARVANDEP